MRRHGRMLVLAALVAGCSSAADEPAAPEVPSHAVEARVDETFRLGVGQVARVGDLYVRFDAVTEDSRCPADVVCVWMGNARVALAVTDGRSAWRALAVNTGQEPKTATALGYTLALEQLQPYPNSAEAIAADAYVAVLKASR